MCSPVYVYCAAIADPTLEIYGLRMFSILFSFFRKKDVSFVNVAELFDFVIGRNLKIWLLK